MYIGKSAIVGFAALNGVDTNAILSVVELYLEHGQTVRWRVQRASDVEEWSKFVKELADFIETPVHVAQEQPGTLLFDCLLTPGKS